MVTLLSSKALASITTLTRHTPVHRTSAANSNRVVLVTDNAIRKAQETLWRVLRVVSELGGAAAIKGAIF